MDYNLRPIRILEDQKLKKTNKYIILKNNNINAFILITH